MLSLDQIEARQKEIKSKSWGLPMKWSLKDKDMYRHPCIAGDKQAEAYVRSLIISLGLKNLIALIFKIWCIYHVDLRYIKYAQKAVRYYKKKIGSIDGR